ncbi:hypothetical protein HY643_03365 [Candidatus Woesearchaeota archaeon]|nr:hypothetical protein [Candidatus Woesearchaeota archaeon]
MGIIKIGPNGEEEINTYKEQKNQKKQRELEERIPLPELQIIPITEERTPTRIPIYIPNKPTKKQPEIDPDFKIPLYHKIPNC